MKKQTRRRRRTTHRADPNLKLMRDSTKAVVGLATLGVVTNSVVGITKIIK